MRPPACLKDTAAPALRILLVDDNRLGLAARKAILEEQGYEITTAGEGLEALTALQNGSFDLVITDYRMPNMDGLKLIETIRERHASLPVILVSGYAQALGMTEESTGADTVITKDAHEIRHLIRAVNRLLKPAPKKPVQLQRARPAARRRSG